MRLALLVFCASLGCAAIESDSASVAAAGFTPQCTSDAQCSADAMCKAPYGLCVTREHNTSVVALSVSPPAKVAPAIHIPSVSFSSKNTYDVQIPPTVEISGIVKAGVVVVPATIVAVAQKKVINGVLMRSQTVFKTGEPFRLQLFANIPYSITVSVDDGGKTPPHHEDVLFVASATHDFSLPAPDEYARFCGVVRATQENTPVGVKGVRVTAVQPETEDQCTSTVTDKLGSYSLLCPTSARIGVVVSGGDGGPILPTFTTDFNVAQFEVQSSCLALPDVEVPPDTRETSATVEVVDEAGAPVPGIAVTASAVFNAYGWHDAVLSVEGTTDVNGKAALTLLEGVYRVTVAPHPTDPWAIARDGGDWDVVATPTKKVALSLKVMMTTSVVDRSNQPVAGAKVVASASLVDPDTKTSTEREYVAVTSDDGGFQLPVDPDLVYDVEVIPPAASGLPRWWLYAPYTVLPSGWAPPPFQLDAPSLIEGRVLDPAGTPLAETAVDVYTAPTVGPSRLIGRGISDATGRYFVILPCPKL